MSEGYPPLCECHDDTPGGRALHDLDNMGHSPCHEAGHSSCHDADEPAFYWMDLDNMNTHDLVDSAYGGEMFGIVSEEDGGIIAYAIGLDHANQIVDALNGRIL